MVLQRKCACGSHANGGSCDECKKKKEGPGLQRARLSGETRHQGELAPSIVHDVLRSAGEPLDRGARAHFEDRFGYDFSQVRVHTDARAAASARAIDASAYTVGPHIVFTSGEYAPANARGRQLLAHELTHVMQQRHRGPAPSGALVIDPSAADEHAAAATAAQSNSPAIAAPSLAAGALQRACLTGSACPAAAGQAAKTAAVRGKAENKKKEERRKKLCTKRPRDPACTSDGHSRRAVQVETLLARFDRDRLTLIHGAFVDKDIPDDWAAYRQTCNHFMPPINGDKHCIFVPEELEREAKTFNTTDDPKIGTMTRDEWQRRQIRILMHETGHARFAQLAPDAPSATACAIDTIWSELQEIAADMDEIQAFDDLLARQGLTGRQRDDEIGKVLTSRWIGRALDNWLKIRCTCDCADADSYVRRSVETMTVDWDDHLRRLVFGALQQAEATWPVGPPGPLGPGDFPMPSPDTGIG